MKADIKKNPARKTALLAILLGVAACVQATTTSTLPPRCYEPGGRVCGWDCEAPISISTRCDENGYCVRTDTINCEGVFYCDRGLMAAKSGYCSAGAEDGCIWEDTYYSNCSDQDGCYQYAICSGSVCQVGDSAPTGRYAVTFACYQTGVFPKSSAYCMPQPEDCGLCKKCAKEYNRVDGSFRNYGCVPKCMYEHGILCYGCINGVCGPPLNLTTITYGSDEWAALAAQECSNSNYCVLEDPGDGYYPWVISPHGCGYCQTCDEATHTCVPKADVQCNGSGSTVGSSTSSMLSSSTSTVGSSTSSIPTTSTTTLICPPGECCMKTVAVSCEAGSICCGGDRVSVQATYEGVCPPSLFIQVDMENAGAACTLCDDQPTGVDGCDDQCSMDGVSAPAFCTRGVCTGYYILPRGIYAVSVAECKGQTLTPTAAAAYTNNFYCDGGSYYEPPDEVSGSIHFGTQQECLQQCAGRQGT